VTDDGRATESTRRGVRMTEDEAWEFLRDGHTGILTTLRQDGSPVALPIWYAAIDGRIYVRTRGAKVVRARNDPRCSFLVESGTRWAELRAVHLTCSAAVLEEVPEDLAARIRAEMKRKYAAFRTSGTAMPAKTREHYAEARGAVIELTPIGRALTWDNTHLGLG
jgi:nitroimidazol reductase NimA-like FMN-containing flavoprotein (pyridoxamine 5'-phosphate oxidase superfamily)